MRIRLYKLGFSVLALTFVFSVANFAQDSDKKMRDMQEDPAMAEMMKSQNHRVMMTYRKSLLGYAAALRDLAKDTDNFNVVFAKALFEDIERSSRMMDMVHQDHMSRMDSKAMEKMAPMMKKMKSQKAELKAHITALGNEINADSINTKEIEKQASAIVESLENKKMDDKQKMKTGMDHKSKT